MTEKTLRYTTLKGLINKTNQFSFNTFLNKRMHHNKYGWVNFRMTDKLYNEISNLFKSFLGLSENLVFSHTTYGIYERLIIEKRDLKVHYIAGQDYPSELRYLKGLIKKG